MLQDTCVTKVPGDKVLLQPQTRKFVCSPSKSFYQIYELLALKVLTGNSSIDLKRSLFIEVNCLQSPLILIIPIPENWILAQGN